MDWREGELDCGVSQSHVVSARVVGFAQRGTPRMRRESMRCTVRERLGAYLGARRYSVVTDARRFPVFDSMCAAFRGCCKSRGPKD